MKYRVILLIILASSIIAIEWMNFYSRTWTSSCEFRDAIEAPNGNIVYFGAAIDTLWIVHADSAGIILRDSIYENVVSCFPEDAATLLDSTIAICASKWTTYSDCFYILYWPSLDSLEHWFVPGFKPLAITATPDSGFAMSGYMYPLDSVCVFKIAYDSWNIQWSKCIYLPSYYPRDICADSDGTLNMVADNGATTGFKYVRVGYGGESVHIYDVSPLIGPFSIQNAHNGGYLIAGVGNKYAKIDSMADVLWESDVSWFWTVNDIVKLPNYRYGLSGSQNIGGRYEFIFAVLDSSGIILDTTMYSLPDTSVSIWNSCLCKNNDVLFAGRIVESVAGRSGCGIRHTIDSTYSITEINLTPSEFNLKVSPNPFNSSVAIYAPQNARIEIFDINGKLISKIKANIWSPSKDVGSGIYFVRAKFGEQSVTKRLVYLK